MKRTYRKNAGFGPAFEILNQNGDVIAAAHDENDATSFCLGQIEPDELTARNQKHEEPK